MAFVEVVAKLGGRNCWHFILNNISQSCLAINTKNIHILLAFPFAVFHYKIDFTFLIITVSRASLSTFSALSVLYT